MRPSDIEELQRPFAPGDTRSPGEQLAAALRVGAPSAPTLAKCVLDDLDTDTFGVSWWRDQVPTKRRILIADQLYLVTATIETNLIEARLHLLEAIAAFEHSSRTAPGVSVGPDGIKHEMKRPENAASQLPNEFARLHVVGFFRAIGSALDCLGSSIIGVLALPTSLLRGDLGKAQTKLAKVDGASSAGAAIQADFSKFLSALVTNSGPAGWLDWTIDYRNMLVHRGRHFSPWIQKPTGVALWVAGETRKVALDSLLLLSRDPGRGEIDAMRGFAEGHVLTEEAQITMEGIYESTQTLIEKCSRRLIEIWRERRSNPNLLVQPDAQWPDTALPKRGAFGGYAPHRVQFTPTKLVVNPSFTKRMRAAALDGDGRARWAKLK